MEALLNHLQANKVTVDIKPNEFHEMHVFNAKQAPSFSFDNFFTIKMMTKQPQRHDHTRHDTPKAYVDPLLYLGCFRMDNTITLLKSYDVQRKVESYKQQLINDLTNDKALYKKLKFKLHMKTSGPVDVEAAIKDLARDENATQLVTYYYANMWKSNIAIGGVLSTVYDLHATSYVNLDLERMEMHDMSNGFAEILQSFLASQNLKHMLVKDIRKLATFLKLPTTKPGEGPLLKEELVNSIKNITSPISST